MDNGIVMDNLEQAQAFFRQDRFATDSGMTVEDASAGRSVIRLALTEAHRNAVGGVMGGVILAMADFACAVASNFGTGTGQYVSADAHVSFLRPCRGGIITAEAVCLKSGEKLSFFEVLIRDEQDVPLAKAAFTMCRVKPSPSNHMNTNQ